MFLVETLLNLVIYVISAVKTQTEAPFLIYYYICHQHRFSIRCLFVLISHHFKSLILVFVRKKKRVNRTVETLHCQQWKSQCSVL